MTAHDIDIREQQEPFVPSGEIVAQDVTVEEFMARYAATHHELVAGYVVKMSPVHIAHQMILKYLLLLFDAYFEQNPIGQTVGDPCVLRLPEYPKRRREPDIMVILNDNPNELKPTYMDGAPDICIEIVSPESTARDFGEKFEEYEKGKVSEYWVIDPTRKIAYFYRLNDAGVYQPFTPDDRGDYQSPKLPKLRVNVPLLWEEKLPGPASTVNAVQEMMESEK